MSKWIGLKDRLPKVDELVCIATVSGGFVDYDYARWNGEYWTRKAWPIGYTPSYWMPLPEAPKTDTL